MDAENTEKKKKSGCLKKVVIVIGILLILGIITSMFEPSSTVENQQAGVVEKETEESVQPVNEVGTTSNAIEQDAVEKPKVEDVPTVEEQEVTEPSMLDKLWIAYDNFSDNRDTVDIKYDDSEEHVRLEYSGDGSLNEEYVIRGAYRTLVGYGEEAFKVDGVSKLTVVVKGTLTDQYGKENTRTIVEITYVENEFEKFNWDNLKSTPIYNTIQRTAEYQMIHPALRNAVNVEEIRL